MCGDGKEAYREVPVQPAVKTAEQLYKEWWEKKHHDKTESELRAESTD
jgi:hypothetical protein